MSQPALDAAPEDREVARLRRELKGLELDLAEARSEVQGLKAMSSDAAHAIRNLRKVLDPIRTAILMIYGEIDRVKLPAEGQAPARTNGASGMWTVIMNRLGGKQAEFIELLQSGSMSGPQLKAATKCANKTLYDTIHKLKKGGFIEKNGDLYSLRGET